MDLLDIISVLGLCLSDVLFDFLKVFLQRVYLLEHTSPLFKQFLLLFFESLSYLFLSTFELIWGDSFLVDHTLFLILAWVKLLRDDFYLLFIAILSDF